MNSPTQATTSINYSALSEPVTEADVEAYKQFAGKHSFDAAWMFYVILAVFAGVTFFPISVFMRAFGAPGIVQVIAWLLVVGLGLYAIRYGVAQHNKGRARLYKFALRNNLTFIQKRSNPAYTGMIFDEGHSREIDVAFGFPDKAEMGNYTYVTGSGKNRSVHYWAYIKVKLPRRLPHMVLDAKKNNLFGKFSNLTDTFDSSQTLSLEGDFNEHFTLYAPKQYERDALYVFTPDVMAKLIDNGSSYDMEVIDDELYIYKVGRIGLSNEVELRSMLSIVDAISDELKDQTDYYADERVGDRTQNIIAAPGARLKQGVNWVVVVTIIIMIILYTSDIWGPFVWR